MVLALTRGPMGERCLHLFCYDGEFYWICTLGIDHPGWHQSWTDRGMATWPQEEVTITAIVLYERGE